MKTERVFTALNDELARRKESRELIICGGAALIALSIVGRETQDVDVLKPKIDPVLHEAALVVGKTLKLSEQWLNNGPALLIRELPADWESQCTEVHSGSHLRVRALGRRDLLYSKLYAAADRMMDIEDLVALKPDRAELAAAREWVLQQDASAVWPQIVDECVSELQSRLGHGS